jgi:hypothetical protein
MQLITALVNPPVSLGRKADISKNSKANLPSARI